VSVAPRHGGGSSDAGGTGRPVGLGSCAVTGSPAGIPGARGDGPALAGGPVGTAGTAGTGGAGSAGEGVSSSGVASCDPASWAGADTASCPGVLATGAPQVEQKRAPMVFGWPLLQRSRTSSPHTPQKAIRSERWCPFVQLGTAPPPNTK
jgi:hypothetical protein